MPSLPTVVTNYLTAVKSSLNTGSDLGQNMRGAAKNFLRAQDMANVLSLLQAALTTGNLTATGGTSKSVQDGVGTFVEHQQVGNTVVFTGNVTAALTGVTAVITANTDKELFFGSALPGTPASGDTYVIRGTLATDVINALRGSSSKGLGDSPAGNVFGDYKLAKKGLMAFLERLGDVQATNIYTLVGNVTGAVAATGTLTLTENAADTNTVTIGSNVYTFQTVLTNVAGNVLIGASASDSLDNLIAAINAGAGSGTLYAAATTVHPTVSAAAGAGDTMTLTAKSKGAAGNSIATTDTLAGASAFGAATLTGGVTGDTVTLGASTYTFEVALTNVAGNVLIGASASDSLDNLIAAINAGAGSGTLYAAATTANASATAAAGAGDTMVVTARTAGEAGNSIASTETGSNSSWGSATLLGGVDGAATSATLFSGVTASGSTTTAVALDLLGGSLNVDQLKGYTLTVSGASRTIVSNTAAGVCTLHAALSGAPSASTAVTVKFPENSSDAYVPGGLRVHPGGQPGDNIRLADLINQVQTAVAAHTLPT